MKHYFEIMVKFHILRYYNCTHPQSPLSLGTSGGADLFWHTAFCFVLTSLDQASLVAQTVKEKKHPSAMQETWVRFLDWEDPLEEGMATHSSILAWRIPVNRGAWRVTVHSVAPKHACFVDQPYLWVPCPLAFSWSHGTPSGANQGATKHLSLQSHT